MMFAIGTALGIASWTLLEYVLHRFVFHRRALGNALAKEHVRHHAEVSYFASPLAKAAAVIPIVGTIAIASMLVVGVELGLSVPLGVAAGYLFYEVLHRRIHVAAPFGGYGRWARRHHLAHHFGRADANHGVTSPLWDWVFGTLAKRATVKVPRRHAAKFPWLLEGDAIATRFSEHYRLVGA